MSVNNSSSPIDQAYLDAYLDHVLTVMGNTRGASLFDLILLYPLCFLGVILNSLNLFILIKYRDEFKGNLYFYMRVYCVNSGMSNLLLAFTFLTYEKFYLIETANSPISSYYQLITLLILFQVNLVF